MNFDAADNAYGIGPQKPIPPVSGQTRVIATTTTTQDVTRKRKRSESSDSSKNFISTHGSNSICGGSNGGSKGGDISTPTNATVNDQQQQQEQDAGLTPAEKAAREYWRKYVVEILRRHPGLPLQTNADLEAGLLAYSAKQLEEIYDNALRYVQSSNTTIADFFIYLLTWPSRMRGMIEFYDVCHEDDALKKEIAIELYPIILKLSSKIVLVIHLLTDYMKALELYVARKLKEESEMATQPNYGSSTSRVEEVNETSSVQHQQFVPTFVTGQTPTITSTTPIL